MTPIFIVGADRSGTTLLRVMLVQHPDIAIPPESHFVPRLWRRRRRYAKRGLLTKPARFLEALEAEPRFRKWKLPIGAVREELSTGRSGTFVDALAAPFRAYARTQDKQRWGDKTPSYAEHVALLDRLWPDAQFIHVIRDGRDVALSVADLPKQLHKHPASAAPSWARRVRHARAAARMGEKRYREVFYEDLVANPRDVLEQICNFLGVTFDPRMLDHANGALEHVPEQERKRHSRLSLPPTIGLRDWRSQMRPSDVREFEAIAGRELSALGYERATTTVRSKDRFVAWSKVAGFMIGSPVARLRLRISVKRKTATSRPTEDPSFDSEPETAIQSRR